MGGGKLGEAEGKGRGYEIRWGASAKSLNCQKKIVMRFRVREEGELDLASKVEGIRHGVQGSR